MRPSDQYLTDRKVWKSLPTKEREESIKVGEWVVEGRRYVVSNI